MPSTPSTTWIVDAATVLAGIHGDVSRRAEATDQSRQSIYDHARKVRTAVEDEYSGGPTRAYLIEEAHRLRHDNAQLWGWLEHTIDFPPARRDEFAITAAAMGLSLDQILLLLAIVFGRRDVPSRSALHRIIQAAGHAASRVLRALDARCRSLVLVGCLDEIFLHRRPVLVGIEPASLVWFLGQRAEDCQGETWGRVLRAWVSLEYVVSDAGKGLQAGIAQARRERRDGGCPSLESGLDVFHTAREARRILTRMWVRVERLWDNAELAARKDEEARRSGRDGSRWAECSEDLWSKAIAAFDEYERAEAGWRLARSALQVMRPDGQLNDREWAEGRVASASSPLSGPEWSKVRGLLQAPESYAFLDRLHRQLREAEPRDDLRRELLRLWSLRRQRPRKEDASCPGGSGHVAHLVQMVACQKQDARWAEPYARISRILRGAVRASSAVECMNSVIRMHQARHRTMTQGLLDLKRLYWNSRPFRGGKRRGRSPYEHLGLALPAHDFWSLLHMTAEEVA